MSISTRAAGNGVAAATALLLCACSGPQSLLDPRGPQAQTLSNLYWIFFWVCAVVWTLVVLALAWALWRRRADRPDPLATDKKTETRLRTIVGTLAVLTGGIVIVLAVLSYAGQASLFAAPQPGSGVTLKVTGNQWWWRIEYQNPDPSQQFITANEIHIPVGEPITVRLTSTDVIHSFWVPSLMGKMDAITGRENEITFTAGEAGVFRGQCAEFCGLQHAHMGLIVYAEPREQFDAWRMSQIAPAAEPMTDSQRAGQQVFMSNPCVICHAIRGTPAGGQTGPDLTHIASRTSLAAATLPLTRGALASWVIDPQSTKPGAQMPTIQLAPAELHALLDYLESLK